jgi:peptide/nickel transport system ATP-binding protein
MNPDVDPRSGVQVKPGTTVRPNVAALTVENLDVVYRVRGRDLKVLRNLSFRIGPGESYGLVGESGCGKSTLALAVVRYLPPNGRLSSGRILIGERDLLALGSEEMRQLRATALSMVYQDPARALNPSMRVGEQIAEIFRQQGLIGAQARDMTIAMLERVQLADPTSVFDRYPHQISGGMQQRVSIAMALSINPKLLILDEPTTGLDATVEAEILGLMGKLRSEFATSILFISHNIDVVTRMCDRVGVLYAGTLIEEGPTADVFSDPRHPYTVGLMRCLPRRGRRKGHGRLDSILGLPPSPGEDMQGCMFAPRCGLAEEECRSQAPRFYELGNRFSRCHFHARAQALPSPASDDLPSIPAVDRSGPPMLRAMGLSKSFGNPRHPMRALHDVSLQLWAGETLGLVGESGSGKTTLARLLLGLVRPDPGGVVELDGRVLAGAIQARSPNQLKSLQIVFQNPDSALNRSHSVRRLIGRVLHRLGGVPKPNRTARLLELTRSVRLADRYLNVRPRQLSGGLKQRVAIARAFAGEPRIVVCDEPTSALDASIQAAILNLLTELQMKHKVSYLFISHDLGAVRYVSDRIAVLYLGRLMEIGPAERVFSGPHHPYTAALLSALPSLGDSASDKVEPRVPVGRAATSTERASSGCVFHTRCARKLGPLCEQQEPPLHQGAEPGHEIRCHIPAYDLPTHARNAWIA